MCQNKDTVAVAVEGKGKDLQGRNRSVLNSILGMIAVEDESSVFALDYISLMVAVAHDLHSKARCGVEPKFFNALQNSKP
ncbi:hypothetical protein ACTXT7_011678 [Hymenolepis weldensis]